MMPGNPIFYQRLKNFGLSDNFISISSRGNIGSIVVDFIPLAPTYLKVLRQRCSGGTDAMAQCLKRCGMVTPRT